MLQTKSCLIRGHVQALKQGSAPSLDIFGERHPQLYAVEIRIAVNLLLLYECAVWQLKFARQLSVADWPCRPYTDSVYPRAPDAVHLLAVDAPSTVAPTPPTLCALAQSANKMPVISLWNSSTIRPL